ncbi:MAG: hypothetical protein SFW62_02335 [Alphaproteobacteria bacterium]|nr:hypothetical protein [Alphaproteobacteria bacterium]
MSQSSGNNNEPTWTMLLLFIAIFLALWLVWHFFKLPLLEALRWLRFGEIWIIHLFTGNHGACLDWLQAVQYGVTSPPPAVISAAHECFGIGYLTQLPAAESVDRYSLSVAGLADIGKLVTSYDRWLLAAACAVVGVHMVFFSRRNKFRTTHTLESFIKVQSKMWPVISPIVNFNPSKFSARRPGDPVPEKLPPFAEALSPEEWIAWHRIPVVNGIPDREAARRAFLLQLGPRWNGIDTTPPYVQALFAAFALKGVQKREDSDNLLGRLSLCWSSSGGLNLPSTIMDEVRRINRDSAIGGEAIKSADQHAYRATAMLGTLRWARFMGGVLAPAHFLWLRAVDRTLWYPMNNLGRRSFHTEGAGAMAHFMAEQNARKPLPIPRVDTAIVTLNQYLASSNQPIPPREGESQART